MSVDPSCLLVRNTNSISRLVVDPVPQKPDPRLISAIYVGTACGWRSHLSGSLRILFAKSSQDLHSQMERSPDGAVSLWTVVWRADLEGILVALTLLQTYNTFCALLYQSRDIIIQGAKGSLVLGEETGSEEIQECVLVLLLAHYVSASKSSDLPAGSSWSSLCPLILQDYCKGIK